jgi:Sulfotransferase domain
MGSNRLGNGEAPLGAWKKRAVVPQLSTRMGSFSRTVHSVSVNRWTLERFGLNPSTLVRRLGRGRAPAVFCVSMPKSGTHLLERALCLHPALYRKVLPTVSDENLDRWQGLDGLLGRLRPGQVVMSHLRFRPGYEDVLARHQARSILMVRDPRDVVVSQVHYVSKRTDHGLHTRFAQEPSVKDKLRLAIVGDPAHKVPSIGDRLGYFAGWLGSGCLVVRFEDLVGPEGGGERARQRACVTTIFDHLGLQTSESAVDSMCERLFSSDSPTFRRGRIGQWTEYFDEDLLAEFDEVVGERAMPFGYGRVR